MIMNIQTKNKIILLACIVFFVLIYIFLFLLPGATKNKLIGYWNFDEGSGQTVNDLSIFSNNGILGVNDNVNSDDPEWIEGRLGGGLLFDGKNDYLNLGNSNDFNLNGGLTIEAWIDAENIAGQTQTIFSKENYELKERSGQFIWQVTGDSLGWSESGEVGNWPAGMAVYNGKLYVSCFESDDIYVFDGVKWSKSGDVGENPAGMAVYNGKLYVVCYGSGEVYVFDGVKWSKSGDVGHHSLGIAVYNDKLYVACYGVLCRDIYVFDGEKWSQSEDVVGDEPSTFMVYNGKLYVSCYESDEVYVFDGEEWSKSGDVGKGPSGFAVYNDKLYLSCYKSNEVYVFDGVKWLKLKDVGDGPRGLVVYNGELYVACIGSNNIYVFDGERWYPNEFGQSTFSFSIYDGKLYATSLGSSQFIHVFGSGKSVSAKRELGYNFVSVYFKEGEIGISVNGKEPITAKHFLSGSNNSDFYIGKGYGSSQSAFSGGSSEFFKGAIDEFRIYNDVRPLKDIRADYNEGLERL